jgi:hypothetical protein
MSRANAITTNIIKQCNMQGCTAWRNNVLGVFDIVKGAQTMLSLILSVLAGKKALPTVKEVQRILSTCYRTTAERKGASDVIGYTRHGIFFSIEVKVKGDKLDTELYQETYLNDVGQKGGIAFIVAEEPAKIKLRVFGSSQKITICHPDDFLRLFRLRLDEPF